MSKSKAYLSPRDALAIERGATNKRDALLIRLLFHLGCRISELLPLTAAQVHFEEELIEIKLLKQRFRYLCPGCQGRLSRESKFCPTCGIPVEEVVKKASEELVLRRLPLDKPTLTMLKDLIENSPLPHRRARGLAPEDRLFPFAYRQAYHIVVTAARQAGIPDLVNSSTGKRMHPSPHRFRDAFATMWVDQDDSDSSARVLQERLGHKSIETTWKYKKLAGHEQKDRIEKLPFEEEENDGQVENLVS